MFGVLITSLATLIGEAGSKFAKDELQHHRESYFELAFLNGLFGILLLLAVVFFVPTDSLFGELFGGFVFQTESLPTFLARVLLEMVVIHLFVIGLEKATRATFSFLRMLTIPFLLLTDIALGYEFTLLELMSVGVIFVTVLALLSTHALKRDGMWYVIGGSLTAVATVSLYQYNITHFNSVAGEQLMMLAFLKVYLLSAAVYQSRRNPLRHFKRPRVIFHSLAAGLETVLISFAFLFAPSTIIMTAKRTSAILWAILSGHRFYHEQHIGAKFAGLGILSVGLLMLAYVQ